MSSEYPYTPLHGAMRAQFPCSANPRVFPSLRGKSNKDSTQGILAQTASSGVNGSAKIVFMSIDEKVVDLWRPTAAVCIPVSISTHCTLRNINT
jgi:hypothetical protein